MSEARYVRIVDDGNYTGGQYAGFDFDAIHVGQSTGIFKDQVLEIAPFVTTFYALPNPFRQLTRITFQITEVLSGEGAAVINIGIYDVTGRLVRNLTQVVNAGGTYGVSWNGDDDNGQKLPAGVYFAKAGAGADEQYAKITLLK
ncbi:MAG: T9SS type A sorting domain-containing protein [candidate division Zixibacteria bacterium]|nr:T9SS type A sorting domain-containing protein [candidate division Zixibacteria bacterium]NIR65359.1 T9SS type A sorting domain-containing protein [candidate division Zixibacteria bacterium]NIS47064.1 T9SS type A sorting domain-containing protein [candidate division Zixibacteria bacterium]NIU15203.1 T9SS type A sorting domain-containing protein [candidate division Zixibacteria bacterium]NIW46436.1 T9SS type A sorting domain-containing protein [Gammaproteobacteria bacterium]